MHANRHGRHRCKLVLIRLLLLFVIGIITVEYAKVHGERMKVGPFIVEQRRRIRNDTAVQVVMVNVRIAYTRRRRRACRHLRDEQWESVHAVVEVGHKVRVLPSSKRGKLTNDRVVKVPAHVVLPWWNVGRRASATGSHFKKYFKVGR